MAKVGPFIKELGFKKALVVTDKFLHKSGITGKVLAVLDEIGVNYVVYDDVKPNPTPKNVYAGADLFKRLFSQRLLLLNIFCGF